MFPVDEVTDTVVPAGVTVASVASPVVFIVMLPLVVVEIVPPV